MREIAFLKKDDKFYIAVRDKDTKQNVVVLAECIQPIDVVEKELTNSIKDYVNANKGE